MTDNIATRAMIVSLQISQWTARKLDKKATAEVAENHQADMDAGRYNKLLLPKESLDGIQKAANAARMYVYAHTLPWRDNGDRVILNTFWFEYMGKMREFEVRFNQEVDSFLDMYNTYREQARFRLNSLFKEDDYPTSEAIKHKFSFRHTVMPLPTAGDFRVDIGTDEQDRLRQEIGASVTTLTNEAMSSVWDEIKATLGHLSAKLGDPNGRFQATTVSKIDDLVQRLPHLNLTNDPLLENFRQEISRCLSGYSADSLREDLSLRSGVANEATRILNQMQGVFASSFDGERKQQ